jgi:hypothetical protein
VPTPAGAILGDEILKASSSSGGRGFFSCTAGKIDRRRGPEVLKPWFATTGVGSLPHLSVEEGVADVLAFCPEYPYWPQLTRLSVREDMYRQFSAGLPGLRVAAAPASGADPSRAPERPPLAWRRDEAVPGELERVYEAVLAGRPGEEWAMAPEDARGLWALEEALRTRPSGSGTSGPGDRFRGVKGQVIGPISLGLAVTGDDGRALLYEEDLMDGVSRALALRARWQERFLGAALGGAGHRAGGPGHRSGDAAPDAGGCGMAPEDRPVLVSVDEPYLGTFGSAYFPYRPETVRGYLEVFDETLGGHWGVHCCANTDWEFLLGSPVRFMSFDAYAYGDKLVLYPEAVKDFLAAGKTLLWGIIPTSAESLAVEDADRLTRRLCRLFETLVARGVPEAALGRQAMITPACGLAGLSVEDARRAMSLAVQVSTAMRENWSHEREQGGTRR